MTVPPHACTTLLLLALALGACTPDDPSSRLTLEQSVATPHLVALAAGRGAVARVAAALPAEAATSLLPPAHASAGGVLQETPIDGGAVKRVSDGITIAVPADPLGHGPALFGKPYEPAIRAELTAAFPGIAMQVMTRASANVYGPYGLALGRSGSDVRCLYAWQWIDDTRVIARAELPGPVGVRVRLCRTGRSFDDLAAEIDHLTLGRDAPATDASAIVETSAAPEPVEPHRRAEKRHHRRPSMARHSRPMHRSPDASTATRSDAPGAPQSFAEAAPLPDGPKLLADLPAEAYHGPTDSGPAKARP